MRKNCIRKVSVFVVALLLSKVSAFAKEVILGGKAGWSAFAESKNVTMGKGRYGYECVQIASNSFKNDEFTDLLIDFEDPDNPISDGEYSIRVNNLKISNQTKMEKFAGLSRNIGGLSVFGKPGTFFGSEGLMGSFSIEFWLCPSIAENGEIIMRWESSKTNVNRLTYQMITAVFNKGHLEWTLTNLFEGINDPLTEKEIILKGSKAIIPDKWSYHVLSYDCETGCLEYLVNGLTEDLCFVTSNGQENGEVSLVVLGTPSEVAFCSEYTGKIDDIRIMRRPYEVPENQTAEQAGKIGHTQYIQEGGRFVSKPIMVSTGSRLDVVKAEMSVPDQTAVCLYVRSGENFYGWNAEYPKWIPVENNQELKGITGLYFQVAADLYPDGNGDVSPKITEINLEFTELSEPLPPFVVRAEAGNGSVTVSWNYSVDDSAGGYYLYYGNRPGEYLGRAALEGESPINVGNTTSYTVSGLENGKIYYFAVAAWSAFDDRVTGKLSKEVFARPLSRLNK
ncbi:MAG: fibronectin type III domain-containing protein [Treponema sp.]|nr:fibronectin type III domain-containing protein [Treponema sp.]